MRALKALVVGMGIAIVIGASVLATLIFERGTRLAATKNPAPPSALPTVSQSVPPSAATPAARKLLLPAGAEVRETRLDGSRIVLRARLAGGGEAIFVFDGADGRPLARYEITPEGAR